jgi:RIO kinase 1
MHYNSDSLSELEDEATWQPRKSRKPKRSHHQIMAELVEDDHNTEGGFNPSFRASRHERAWILTYLGPFYNDHLISDVLGQVKGGKEAMVYRCQAHPATGVELLAAKLYRPSIFRTLKNDAVYRTGRQALDEEGKPIQDRRRQRAMLKKTNHGRALLHNAWLAHEFETLRLLYEAGAAVPRPLARGENAILMGYVGDGRLPASTLNHVTLRAAEAGPLLQLLLDNVELFLSRRRVHGDLSAYNVLYWQGQATIIDFPQAVDPYTNPAAFGMLTRDLTRLCHYFAQYGPTPDPIALATALWQRHIPVEFEALYAEAAPPD